MAYFSRSLLTLKPLLKIDPKRKRKESKIEEEDESEIQEEWEAEEERNRIAEEKATNEALIKNFDDIKARIEADRILAETSRADREQFTKEEKQSSFMIQLLHKIKKIPCSTKIRGHQNRPPTKINLEIR
ncbi:hypothetical protein Tco_1275722 [Tanacetum coccineum]